MNKNKPTKPTITCKGNNAVPNPKYFSILINISTVKE